MAAGDEESLKAMNAQFMHVWVRPRRKWAEQSKSQKGFKDTRRESTS
jgi:hypothetical protein